MKINLIASTKPGYIATKEEWDNFSGKTAGVCYMPGTFEDLVNEDIEKTKKRVVQTKGNQHHSVYDHEQVSLYLDGIPKILAMMINNEKMYTTSEKSARYTKMVMSDETKALYEKWCEIFSRLIKDKYQEQYPAFFSDNHIKKLAYENARYLISVFTPTSMVYTTSYRQLNILYGFMQKLINNEKHSKFDEMLTGYVKEFCAEIEKTNYLDKDLYNNNKNRSFSLIKHLYDDKYTLPVEYFGDVYAINYKGSFAQLAQAQRHRTLSYSMQFLKEPEFYIPKILLSDNGLVEEWKKDCMSQVDNYPQGMLVNISEMGTLDNFILKMKERKCTFAQLEINNQTDETLNRYISGLEKGKHPRASELRLYTKGSRCTFPDYKCPSPCGFADGVKGVRVI